MSIEKEQWAERQGRGYLSASQVGLALGLRGCISDFIQYERELKYTHLAFCGNSFTTHGIRFEPVARAVYEYWTGNHVAGGGFFVHQTHSFLGCSPDGIVVNSDGSIGLLEIKSPYYSLYAPGKPENMSNGIPKIYMCQMQCQMHIVNAPYCDFFVYLHSNGDRVLWRVRKSQAWWSWALNKLQLVSRAISSDTFPEAMQSRQFRFPEFDFDLIHADLIVASKESETKASLRDPVGFDFVENHIYRLYQREAFFQREKPDDNTIVLSRWRYRQSRIVKILTIATERDPFFLVSDIQTASVYRVLGKNIFPIFHNRYSNTSHAIFSRKRLSCESDVESQQRQVTPLLHSLSDIAEYYSMLANTSHILVVDGSVSSGDEGYLARLRDKVTERFGGCTLSKLDDFRQCLLNESLSETHSSHLTNLLKTLTEESVQFIFIIDDSDFGEPKIQLPMTWTTPILCLNSKKSSLFQKSEYGYAPNLIFWCDGRLRHRLSVIEKYWT